MYSKRILKPGRWYEEFCKIQRELKDLFQIQILDNPYVNTNKVEERISILEKRRSYLLTAKNIKICKKCGSIIYPFEFNDLGVHKHKDLCVDCSKKLK